MTIRSQKNPGTNFFAMILDDEVSANSIMKRATKHCTIKIIYNNLLNMDGRFAAEYDMKDSGGSEAIRRYCVRKIWSGLRKLV